MKCVIIYNDGRYTHHGIGYTEHDGYSGTMDNRMSLKLATAIELRKLQTGEDYQLVINDKAMGVFTK